jgi:hypothetical protein
MTFSRSKKAPSFSSGGGSSSLSSFEGVLVKKSGADVNLPCIFAAQV